MSTKYVQVREGFGIVAETDRDPKVSWNAYTPGHYCDLGTKEIVEEMYKFFPELQEGDFIIKYEFGKKVVCQVRGGKAYSPPETWHNNPRWRKIRHSLVA